MNGMGLIVKTVTRVTVGCIFIFGCYLTVRGHTTLGGGITGGFIVSLAFILFGLAYGRTEAEERLSKRLALVLMELSAVFLLLLSFIGCRSEGCSEFILYDLAMMVMVGSGIFVGFINLVAFKVKVREEK